MYSKDEIKLLRKEFWEGFGLFCENLPRFKYRKKHWILYNTKIKGVEMKFDASAEGAFVILEFNHPNESKRLEMLTLVERYKAVLTCISRMRLGKSCTSNLAARPCRASSNNGKKSRCTAANNGASFTVFSPSK